MIDTIHNRRSGSKESHVERAKRGPTPDNPSLSPKKRLKRAAALDQRERLAAEGKAEPIDAGAGLPERMSEDAGFMLRPRPSSRSETRPA